MAVPLLEPAITPKAGSLREFLGVRFTRERITSYGSVRWDPTKRLQEVPLISQQGPAESLTLGPSYTKVATPFKQHT
jgi:hypothetical protein